MKKKDRLKIRKEIKKEFPKWLAANVYPLPLLDRIKVAWTIIKKS